MVEKPKDKNLMLLEKYQEVQVKYEDYFHPYPELEMGEYIFTFYNVLDHSMVDILNDLNGWLDDSIHEQLFNELSNEK